jgi:hypothetical protein
VLAEAGLHRGDHVADRLGVVEGGDADQDVGPADVIDLSEDVTGQDPLG